MRPESTRIWRKTARTAAKGAGRGRLATHKVLIDAPRRRSTWLRRNPSDNDFWFWHAHAGQGRIPAGCRKASTADGPAVLALTESHPSTPSHE